MKLHQQLILPILKIKLHNVSVLESQSNSVSARGKSNDFYEAAHAVRFGDDVLAVHHLHLVVGVDNGQSGNRGSCGPVRIENRKHLGRLGLLKGGLDVPLLHCLVVGARQEDVDGIGVLFVEGVKTNDQSKIRYAYKLTSKIKE